MIFPDVDRAEGCSDAETRIVRVSKTDTQSYRSLLQEPTAFLVSSLNDRPDVATVAILGYN